MLDGLDALFGERVACGHGGEAPALLIVLVVLAFLIEPEKAVEAHDLAGGAQLELANGGGGAHLGCNLDRCTFQLRRFHLAGDGAGPDEVVEGQLFGLQISGHLLWQPRGVGGAHGLMGLLRILLLGRIGAGRLGHIGRAILLGDDLASARHRLRRHVDAVRTHISYETHGLAAQIDAFIEPLCELHGAGGGESQLAGGFLLQGRGGEGRGGVAPGGLGLHRGHRELRLIEPGLEGARFGLGADVEAGDLLAVSPHEAGDEGRLVLGEEVGGQRPVLALDEFLDFHFAVADQPQGHGLDATS